MGHRINTAFRNGEKSKRFYAKGAICSTLCDWKGRYLWSKIVDMGMTHLFQTKEQEYGDYPIYQISMDNLALLLGSDEFAKYVGTIWEKQKEDDSKIPYALYTSWQSLDFFTSTDKGLRKWARKREKDYKAQSWAWISKDVIFARWEGDVGKLWDLSILGEAWQWAKSHGYKWIEFDEG